MATADDLFLREIRRNIRRLQPDIARAYLELFDSLRQIIGEASLESLIRTVGVDRLALEVLSDDALEPALRPLRAALQEAISRAAVLASTRIPGVVEGVAFNVLNPRVIDGIRALEARVMTTLVEDIREAFRAHVEAGLELGLPPRTVAIRTRAIIGLAPNQVAAVLNFRRMLEEGDLTALTRELRVHRFDRTLRRALGPNGTGLSSSQISTMSGAYERRFLAFNAETNARTATLQAMKLGQRISWEDAIDQGVVDRNKLRKRWRNVGDDRVRDEHREPLNGEVVSFDEPFSNGQMIPGETDFNCRCVPIYFEAITVSEPGRRVA